MLPQRVYIDINKNWCVYKDYQWEEERESENKTSCTFQLLRKSRRLFPHSMVLYEMTIKWSISLVLVQSVKLYWLFRNEPKVLLNQQRIK